MNKPNSFDYILRVRCGNSNINCKVEEFIVLIEELQKRVLKLQSGAEMEGLRQQLEAAAGLAERQDELLEQASARLEILKDESR